MDIVHSRFWEFFFALFESLPRQGPGNRASAGQALGLCRELPVSPVILDLGCGAGGQTLHLAELSPGSILAIDSHAPGIQRLQEKIAMRGLSNRVEASVGDMARLELPAEHFDLIWSEGALYNLGLQTALPICRRLLKPGGYLVFTDPVWRKQNPPPHIKDAFEADYPTMGTLEDNLAAIRQGGFEVAGHFPLPDEAWWDDFYTPMEAQIAALRITHAGDAEAQAILDQLAAEPENHRRFGDFYAYVFFVARRPTPQKPLMPNQV